MEFPQDRGAEIRAAIDNGDGQTAEALLLQALFGDPETPAEGPTES